jgi:peptide chain release factor subunit 1
VLAGLADFKTDLAQSDMFDPRLKAIILKIVDVSYGGENGFNQAIELSAEVLANVKFIQEKKLISKFFEEISQDTGKYCYGIKDTLAALDIGAVETLVVWENLECNRYKIKHPISGGNKERERERERERDFILFLHVLPLLFRTEEKVLHLTKEQEKEKNWFRDEQAQVDWEVLSKESLLEWFAENYKRFGAGLEFVTNRSQEGSQFVKGFGGIGGLLRYRVDLGAAEQYEENAEYDELEEFF